MSETLLITDRAAQVLLASQHADLIFDAAVAASDATRAHRTYAQDLEEQAALDGFDLRRTLDPRYGALKPPAMIDKFALAGIERRRLSAVEDQATRALDTAVAEALNAREVRVWLAEKFAAMARQRADLLAQLDDVTNEARLLRDICLSSADLRNVIRAIHINTERHDHEITRAMTLLAAKIGA